jgi:hypothetical protein
MQHSRCNYCDGQDHYSKEYTIKAAHIHKGWIVVEDGQQRLADGNYIPRGKGAPALCVEEYWQKKGVSGQHMLAESFYGAADNEIDALRDEIRTLRVKMNQVTNGGFRTPPVQPSFLAASPVPPQLLTRPFEDQVSAVPVVNMEEFGHTVFNMMKGTQQPDRYLQTCRGARSDPPEQDF